MKWIPFVTCPHCAPLFAFYITTRVCASSWRSNPRDWTSNTKIDAGVSSSTSGPVKQKNKKKTVKIDPLICRKLTVSPETRSAHLKSTVSNQPYEYIHTHIVHRFINCESVAKLSNHQKWFAKFDTENLYPNKASAGGLNRKESNLLERCFHF